MINRFNRGFACCGQLDGELVNSLLVSPRRDVQLVGGDFVNNADEDANDERDDNEDALLSLNIDELSDTLGHSSSTDLSQRPTIVSKII